MEVRSYNVELGIANLLFKRLFSNILIERTDKKTGDKKLFPVTCVLELRSRIIKNWENAERRASYQLPMIAINRTGYSRNGDRLNNMHNEVKFEITSTNRNENLLTPVPIDISYDVSILAKYPSDIDLIASNFMVFFNSDVYVSCVHPKYEGIKMNNLVIMSDSVTEEHPGELDGTADDFISTTFQFTFKTYLFGGMQLAKRVPDKILSSYVSSFTSAIVVELTPDIRDSYISAHPNAVLSATELSNVTATLTTLVDNPDISSTVYDGFTPIINLIDVGFYPTPHVSAHVDYMNEVDSYPISAKPFYFDALLWKINAESTAEFPYNVTFS